MVEWSASKAVDLCLIPGDDKSFSASAFATFFLTSLFSLISEQLYKSNMYPSLLLLLLSSSLFLMNKVKNYLSLSLISPFLMEPLLCVSSGD